MTGQDIRLVAPDESWEAEYREYLADYAAAGEKHEHLPAAEADFAATSIAAANKPPGWTCPKATFRARRTGFSSTSGSSGTSTCGWR